MSKEFGICYTNDISPISVRSEEWLINLQHELDQMLISASRVILQKLLEEDAGAPLPITLTIDTTSWVWNCKLVVNIECADSYKQWPWRLSLEEAQKQTFDKELGHAD